MKLIIASTAIALGFSLSAFAAEPAADHSQHQQRAQSSAPQQSPHGTAQGAPKAHMQHHEGMKMEGCCCCKKDAEGQTSDSANKATAPAPQEHDLSNH